MDIFKLFLTTEEINPLRNFHGKKLMAIPIVKRGSLSDSSTIESKICFKNKIYNDSKYIMIQFLL